MVSWCSFHVELRAKEVLRRMEVGYQIWNETIGTPEPVLLK
jgi:hypothetical protein